MVNVSLLMLVLVSLVSGLVGSLGTASSPAGLVGGVALFALAFGIASLVGALSVLLRYRLEK